MPTLTGHLRLLFLFLPFWQPAVSMDELTSNPYFDSIADNDRNWLETGCQPRMRECHRVSVLAISEDGMAVICKLLLPALHHLRATANIPPLSCSGKPRRQS
ncbi:hypothetical protein N656DRAFT_132285 [Canariomyces notabilis]|uniref:Uncharacterized protein n=1 Tax=Canariomyces notabilis TaxID=2074819 RepID=A0AAN6TCQ9_9PEZI|nr:hypothetical protein N656DRAFT_132285 [Canariomyces arenarius]